MRTFMLRPLLALALLALVLLAYRPLVLAATRASRVWVSREVRQPAPSSGTPPTGAGAEARSGGTAGVSGAVIPSYRALGPCALETQRAACAAYARELAAYGLDIAELSPWTTFGLGRFVGAIERLADALGGEGLRARRIARFSATLGTDTASGRVPVLWQPEPQERAGLTARGGYAAGRLFFNPNTYFLDTDTPEEALARPAAAMWWLYIHELAHLWDERAAPLAGGRPSAAMQRWVRAQEAVGGAAEYPSSYAVIGGAAETFAESVAATVTGDAAIRDYYGSPRDRFVRALLAGGDPP